MLIYDRIKEICKKKGISPSALEKKAGLGNGAVTKWNDFSPSVKNLKAVADVLEITVDDLIKNC